MVAYQMVTVLEYIHNKHILHRDIKPDNFVMGLDELSQNVYLLDFGLAKKYRSSTTLVPYPLVNKKKLTGTARYASINALRGYEHARRDDLEAVGYFLMYFLRGSLPWQGLQANTKEERYKKILQKKLDTSTTELCYGFPNEFKQFIDYNKSLDYNDEPDYQMLRDLFINVIKRENGTFDYIYDWTTPEEKKFRKDNAIDSNLDSINKAVTASVKQIYFQNNNRHKNNNTEKENEKNEDKENQKHTNKNSGLLNHPIIKQNVHIYGNNVNIIINNNPINNNNNNTLHNNNNRRYNNSPNEINIDKEVIENKDGNGNNNRSFRYRNKNRSTMRSAGNNVEKLKENDESIDNREEFYKKRNAEKFLNENEQAVCCSSGCKIF